MKEILLSLISRVMMGKNPADQFYWQDFYRDLHGHPLEIVGAWILILCKLWYEDERGVGTKNIKIWSKFLSNSDKICLKFLRYLQKSNIATIPTNLENSLQFYQKKDVTITVISRRMVEREKQRKYDKLRNKNYYETTRKRDEKNPHFNVNSAEFQQPSNKEIQQEIPASLQSSYLLTSNIKKPESPQIKKKEDNPYGEKIDLLREKLYRVYWCSNRSNVHAWVLSQFKRKIKAKAILYCLMRVDEERPNDPWAYCEGILKKYNDGELHKKDNIFQDVVDKLKMIQVKTVEES